MIGISAYGNKRNYFLEKTMITRKPLRNNLQREQISSGEQSPTLEKIYWFSVGNKRNRQDMRMSAGFRVENLIRFGGQL